MRTATPATLWRPRTERRRLAPGTALPTNCPAVDDQYFPERPRRPTDADATRCLSTNSRLPPRFPTRSCPPKTVRRARGERVLARDCVLAADLAVGGPRSRAAVASGASDRLTARQPDITRYHRWHARRAHPRRARRGSRAHRCARGAPWPLADRVSAAPVAAGGGAAGRAGHCGGLGAICVPVCGPR